MQKLIDEIGFWSDQVFGDVSTPVSKLKHLQKEIPELIEAINNQDAENGINQLRYEFADCFMLLFDAARKCNLSAEDILKFTEEKLIINKSRTWNKPDKDGIFEHVRD